MDAPPARHYLTRLPVAFLQAKGAQRPPPEAVQALVNREGLCGHWWWDGDLNEAGEAVLRWSRRYGTKWGSPYPALWLVYLDTVGPLLLHGPDASLFYNTCGHIRCVNPAHWHHVTPDERRAARTKYVETVGPDGRPVLRTVKEIRDKADHPDPDEL